MEKVTRQKQVLDLIAQSSPVSCGQVQDNLQIKRGHASVLLAQMFRAGKLKREGTRRHYRYSAA